MATMRQLVLLVALATSLTTAAAPPPAEQELVGALQAAQASDSAPRQEESYQRVYEAFTKLVSNVSNNSLGNARRLVSRLNQLVGSSSSSSEQQLPASKPAEAGREQQRQQQQQQQQGQGQGVDERTEQILTRLDQVNKNTDQHTLRQLQEDVNRLVGTLSDSYLRNIRRVIERVNKVVGSSDSSAGQLKPPSSALHQLGDRYSDEQTNGNRQPGFPGWDELITAVDRMQKSLASFVRSSTKLITSGRRR